MFGRSDEKRFPHRLTQPLTAERLHRMAWNPSSCAPDRSELLAVDDACRGLDVLDRVEEAGQLVSASVSGRVFISRSAELFRLGPIRDIRLVAVQPFLRELAHCEPLQKLTKLNLSGNQIGLHGLQELLQSPYLQQLQALDLSRNGLRDDAIPVLLAASSINGLRELVICSGNHLSPNSVALLRERFGAVS